MKLHEQRDQLKAERDLLKEGLLELRRYLNSDKFRYDVMVNKSDILLRINELDNELFYLECKRG